MPTSKPRRAADAAKPVPRTASAKAPLKGPATKADTILTLLRRPKGATLSEIAGAAGWQAHSVRGFMSGELKKKRGLAVQSERVNGVLRYRLAKGA